MSIKVVVTGGRTYSNRETLFRVLDEIHAERTIIRLAQGGAKGADALAKAWAQERGVDCMEYRADWNLYGKGAGHRRNETMLQWEAPDLVVSFPGGPGTLDCTRRAIRAGIETKKILTNS